MLSFDVNWLAIIVAAVANMIVGAIWYGAWAEPWLAGIGKTREWANANQNPRDYIVAILNSLAMAFVLANVLAWAGVTGLVGGLVTGLIMWVGFNGLAMGSNHAFEGRSMQLWFINSGVYLVGLLVIGAIVGLWQ